MKLADPDDAVESDKYRGRKKTRVLDISALFQEAQHRFLCKSPMY